MKNGFAAEEAHLKARTRSLLRQPGQSQLSLVGRDFQPMLSAWLRADRRISLAKLDIIRQAVEREEMLG